MIIINIIGVFPPFFCTPFLQGKKWTQDKKALGCQLQDVRYEESQKKMLNKNKTLHADNIYLNSGVSVGIVFNYNKIVEKAKFMVKYYPPLCMDDQGLFAWQLVGEETVPMSLDYNSILFGTLNNKKSIFDTNDGLLKLWYHDKNSMNNISRLNNYRNQNALLSAPFIIHFNGGGKPLYNATRNQIVNHKKKKFNVYNFLLDKTFFVDGKERKFIEVCDKYVHRHYLSTDIK